MADMTHFPKYSVVHGNVKVTLDLRKYGDRFDTAQQWLGDQILTDCRPMMPILTGRLRSISRVEEGGKKVIFPGPYARYVYMGIALSGRPMHYSRPNARARWFEVAKSIYISQWVQGVQQKVTGG